jgi:peptide/nickel transport system substrate-binding protein
LHEVAGFWPDIEKSRTEARRLLKEAGAENLSFELLNRDVDQPYKYVGIWIADEWSKIGVKVTQKILPSGPWVAADAPATSRSCCRPIATASSTR